MKHSMPWFFAIAAMIVISTAGGCSRKPRVVVETDLIGPNVVFTSVKVRRTESSTVVDIRATALSGGVSITQDRHVVLSADQADALSKSSVLHVARSLRSAQLDTDAIAEARENQAISEAAALSSLQYQLDNHFSGQGYSPY